MDDLISILVVDDNATFCNIISDYLNQCGGMIVKGIAKNGIEAIEMIKALKPDIVILDLIMPNLDGIGVLERISGMQLEHRPIFIVLSAIGKDVFIRKAMELGAEYYILKPFDADMLVSRIRQLYNEKTTDASKGINMAMSMNSAALAPDIESTNLEKAVSGIIKSIGIQPNIAGYRYLREAVILSVGNTSLNNLATKNIYHSIAIKHNTTARNVARAITCAIDSAYMKAYNVKNHNKNSIIDISGSKPTNVQVIAALVEKARVEMDNINLRDLS